MKLVIDFDDLTALIMADLTSKGITVDENSIEYNENGVEIVLNPAVKPTKPKRTKKQEPKEEEVAEVPEIEETTSDEPFAEADSNDDLQEPYVETVDDDDDTLFG